MSEADPCRVLVLARPGFLGDYVVQGLRRAGLAVAGPVGTAGELEDDVTAWQGAVIDVGMDPRELLLAAELLSTSNVPIVLIGQPTAGLRSLLRRWPVLVQPFDSCQVVEHLAAAGLAMPAPIASA